MTQSELNAYVDKIDMSSARVFPPVRYSGFYARGIVDGDRVRGRLFNGVHVARWSFDVKLHEDGTFSVSFGEEGAIRLSAKRETSP